MERSGFSFQVISGGMLDRGKGCVFMAYSHAGKRLIGGRNRMFFDVSPLGMRYAQYHKFENDSVFACSKTIRYEWYRFSGVFIVRCWLDSLLCQKYIASKH